MGKTTDFIAYGVEISEAKNRMCKICNSYMFTKSKILFLTGFRQPNIMHIICSRCANQLEDVIDEKPSKGKLWLFLSNPIRSAMTVMLLVVFVEFVLRLFGIVSQLAFTNLAGAAAILFVLDIIISRLNPKYRYYNLLTRRKTATKDIVL